MCEIADRFCRTMTIANSGRAKNTAMKTKFYRSESSVETFALRTASPLTPALSPLRGEGGATEARQPFEALPRDRSPEAAAGEASHAEIRVPRNEPAVALPLPSKGRGPG